MYDLLMCICNCAFWCLLKRISDFNMVLVYIGNIFCLPKLDEIANYYMKSFTEVGGTVCEDRYHTVNEYLKSVY